MGASFTIFVNYCLKYNGGGVCLASLTPQAAAKENSAEILPKIIEFLTAKLPDPKKAESQLLKFAEMNNGRLYKLVRAVMDPSVEYKAILKHNKEIVSILSKFPSILETVAIFLRRVSLCLMNKDTLSVLLQMVKNRKDPLDQTAEQFLKDITKIFPALSKTQVDTYNSIILGDNSTGLIEDALEALSKYVVAFPSEYPSTEATVNKLVQFCVSGTAKQASLAAVILCKTGETKECQDIMQVGLLQLISRLLFQNYHVILNL
jgi:sister-chromatid-cohesion protein PDS5